MIIYFETYATGGRGGGCGREAGVGGEKESKSREFQLLSAGRQNADNDKSLSVHSICGHYIFYICM